MDAAIRHDRAKGNAFLDAGNEEIPRTGCVERAGGRFDADTIGVGFQHCRCPRLARQPVHMAPVIGKRTKVYGHAVGGSLKGRIGERGSVQIGHGERNTAKRRRLQSP